ncbi:MULTISPECIES: 3'-5' exonuclease [unclassified Oceanispirochaeta]|uniref:3'-5' exonuclease n=1 Tax=unclassified Oceanispirochaeta TaxID=2635722 RepID=UPI000E09D72C|nr:MULTISPECIES: 3'-5' exonuclease [unclassified Oceanispirochaeta]MBF9016418.1 3'-5' exonuclease [Oceanispirochaeta sp. M2]NPD72880.1 3'-5' exonuclease [Oceanispirochaeta sp. M1]RDG31457.1 3'-5' exonuclease [Oceanispirochaeta sp. M1]
MKYHYLDTDSKLSDYLDSLKTREIERVSVDLEGEFNLHCYGEHLCLVQIFDGEEYALIDPMKVRITLIRDFFENPDISKIMYDCSGDRTLLFRKYGIAVKNIEDLLPASELLDLEKRNLAFVLTKFLSVEPKAKKKFQQYNWMRRPIQADALEYALDDVRYLFDLKIELLKEVAALNLLDEYEENNRLAQTREILLNPIPGVLKKNRFKKMPQECRDLFKKLFECREEYAERLNMPPNSVVSNENVFRLSQGEMRLNHLHFHGRVPGRNREALLQDFSEIMGED